MSNISNVKWQEYRMSRMSNVKNVMCYQSVLINLAHRLCTDIQYFLYLYNPDDADVVEPYSMNWLDCFASILSPNHQRRLDFDKQASLWKHSSFVFWFSLAYFLKPPQRSCNGRLDWVELHLMIWHDFFEFVFSYNPKPGEPD